MRTRHALLAATLLAVPLAVRPGAAQAQPVTGLYLGAGAGINLWQDETSNGIRLHDADIGFAGVGALGWGFGNGFRAEVEGNYRTSEVDRLSVANRFAGSSGRLNQYGAMANLYFDFDLSSFGVSPRTAMPYIGGGVGYGWTELRNARFGVGGSRYRIDDTDGNFAYQGMFGSAFGLGAGLSVTAEYRFYGTLEPDLTVQRLSGPAAGVASSFKPSNINHSVLFGLRYAFNGAPAPVAAAPPPAPPPPPAVARTYLVFFDWDRADLTDRAKQIVAEAAQNARRVQTTRIEVAGHADRSGTPQYNQRLSQRRADVVAAELVRNGIARTEIAVTAFGETNPLVPTADGVREPQNRRVEIVLR